MQTESVTVHHNFGLQYILLKHQQQKLSVTRLKSLKETGGILKAKSPGGQRTSEDTAE